MSFFTVSKVSTYSLKLKRSQFISYVRHCDSLLDFRSWLSQLRKDHYDASHVCWAYRITENSKLDQHSSDAGEPSGSAGFPILKILKQNDLIQCGLVVIRYFGGIKLGKKGLIDAYGNAAENVISDSLLIKWVSTENYILTCPMELYGDLSQAFQKFDGSILEDQSGEDLKWLVNIKSNKVSDLIYLISNVTKGKGNLEKYKNIEQ